MTPLTATASEFQIQTLEARLLTQKAQRVVDGTWSHVRKFWYGARLATVLPGFVQALRHTSAAGGFDEMGDAEFDALTDELEKLHRVLCQSIEVARGRGVDRHPLHRRVLGTIERNTWLLGDVVESFRLSQDEDFGKLMKETVDTLKT